MWDIFVFSFSIFFKSKPVPIHKCCDVDSFYPLLLSMLKNSKELQPLLGPKLLLHCKKQAGITEHTLSWTLM